MRDRQQKLKNSSKSIIESLDKLSENKKYFTIPFAKFNEIYEPIKNMYWNTAAEPYVKAILTKFYNQCDSVLRSAKLFERFIKTFSIAEFMNNMEERDDV